MAGRKPKIGYLFGSGVGEPAHAFVPHPTDKGVWLRVHPCVLLVACNDCKMPAGVPCMSKKGKYWGGSEHYRRRLSAPRRKAWPPLRPVVIVKYDEIKEPPARTKSQEKNMITLIKEPEDIMKEFGSRCRESCCFCRTPTVYWTTTDVACCQKCAAEHDPSEVPTKQQWFRNERIANGEYPCCGQRPHMGHTFSCKKREPLVIIHKLREDVAETVCTESIDPRLLPEEVSTDWKNVTCKNCRRVASPKA